MPDEEDLLDALARAIGEARVERSSIAYVEPIEPDEPDYDYEYEADRAADRYERWLDERA